MLYGNIIEGPDFTGIVFTAGKTFYTDALVEFCKQKMYHTHIKEAATKITFSKEERNQYRKLQEILKEYNDVNTPTFKEFYEEVSELGIKIFKTSSQTFGNAKPLAIGFIWIPGKMYRHEIYSI